MEEVIKVEEQKWKVVQHLGRSDIPVATGTEEQMMDELKRLRKAGVPGTLELVGPDGKPVAQALGFVDDSKRRGMGPDGKPYEPTVVEVGHPAKDLTRLADIIKSLPETDPDLDEPGTPFWATTQLQVTVCTPSDDGNAHQDTVQVERAKLRDAEAEAEEEEVESKERSKQLADRAKEILGRLEMYEAALDPARPEQDRLAEEQRAKLREAKFPQSVRDAMGQQSPEAKAQSAERVARFEALQKEINERVRDAKTPEPAAAPRPQTRAERMASGPCPHSMHASLLSFFIVLQDSIASLQARQREIESVKKRFVIELVLRLAAGAPICGSTVKAAMVDSGATK